jgi:phosphate-selective porin OprO/OprP
MRRFAILLFVLAAVFASPLSAQVAATRDSIKPQVQFGSKGLVFNATDGFSYLALRFRVQQWILLGTSDDEPGISSSHFALRRARLRLESVVWDPRLKVNFQFSFSRGDMDFENSQFPNVLRDAAVTWQQTPRLSVMAGQTKLPGNRQRVISSGEQQFADRSIVNAAFTIDRDVGVWLTYEAADAALPFVARTAISGGEGRNAPAGDAGLAYTQRIEVYPLGQFTGGGDYFDGDLAREPHPKLSIGLVFSHNEQARRTGGQLGRLLGEPRDIETVLADVLFKYRGFAAIAEFARRTARDPITLVDSAPRAVVTGGGVNLQLSYVTRGNLEPAVRFSIVEPHRDLAGVVERQRQFSFGLTRYLRGHRVKFQAEIMRDLFTDIATQEKRGGWGLRTNLEVGI